MSEQYVSPEFSKPNEIFVFKFNIGFNIKYSLILIKLAKKIKIINLFLEIDTMPFLLKYAFAQIKYLLRCK